MLCQYDYVGVTGIEMSGRFNDEAHLFKLDMIAKMRRRSTHTCMWRLTTRAMALDIKIIASAAP